MKLPIHIAMSAVGGTLFDADNAPNELSICTDTRALKRGDTFLAIKGDRYNGHDYTADAVKLGAQMLIVDESDARVPGTATMLVDRSKNAYMRLAASARDLFKGRVVAVTGSAGKTTTKEFLAQLLAVKYGTRVLATYANENNEFGVSKLLLAADNELHDALVIEMGARKYGDIAALVEMARPEAGVLTNIGDAHVEIMGGRQRLAETKWALFSQGARAVLNADDEESVKRAPQLGAPPHWFCVRDDESVQGAQNAWMTALVGRRLVVDSRGGELAVDVAVPGAHNCRNVAAAIAGALDLDVPLDAMAEAIHALRLPEGRFESFDVAGGWRIIYDAYNANAAGMVAALDAFALEKPQRAIALLGSMAELGEESEALHERVGRHAATRVEIVLVGGDYAAALARGAAKGGLSSNAIVTVAGNADAIRWLRANARKGDAVLLKASRKYRFEEIVAELTS